MKKILLLLLAYFSLSLMATAQMAPDVDTLGNVWVITIDDSGSMLRLSKNPYNKSVTSNASSLASAVSERLRKYPIYDHIDFDHDRFIFYTSGFSFDSDKGLGNELACAPSLDTSFIHHTDAKLYRLKDRDALVQRVKDLMAKGEYKRDLSFVSHIRTFSVVKTVNFLKEAGEAQNFNSLRLLTITDDADQNDQWRTDYKLLSVADNIDRGRKPISQRVKETIQEYVYNDILGTGGGMFTPIYTDVATMPHVWVYEYSTVGSMSDTLRRHVLRISARDGRNVTFAPRHIDFGSDSLCFYSVDSVVVNGVAQVIDCNFNSSHVASFPYRNGLRFNDVKVYGSVQFKYKDDIYGNHFRKVCFIQEQTVPSGVWVVVFIILGTLIGGVLLAYLIYLFLVLPRKTIASLHCGNGSKVELKRGFRCQWRNEVVPVAHYETDVTSVRNVLVRKSGNVIIDASGMDLGQKDLLIISKTRLNVSESDLEHTSMEDLDMHYAFQMGNYPEMLKEHYRGTMASRLRAVLSSSTNPLVRWYCTTMLTLLDRFCPVYYYYFHDISRFDSICFESPNLLADKKFIIESETLAGRTEPTLEEKIVNKALTVYYNDASGSRYDALLCYDVHEGKEYWNIIQLDDPTALHNSMKNVFVVYRYVKDVDQDNMLLNRQMLLSYAKKFMRRYSIGLLDCSAVDVQQTVCFNVTSVPIPGFISMVEYTEKPRAILLYSPFKDGFIKYKYVSLQTKYCDGHLYLSFLPYRYVKPDPEFAGAVQDQMLRRLSVELIRSSDWSSGKMLTEHDSVTYRGIRSELKY